VRLKGIEQLRSRNFNNNGFAIKGSVVLRQGKQSLQQGV
jgi:hypothetical protein